MPLVEKTLEPLVVAKEFSYAGTVDVPSTPLFVDEMPLVERMFGVPIHTNTQGITSETLIFDNRQAELDEESGMVKISLSSPYPHNRSVEWMDIADPLATRLEIAGRTMHGVSQKGSDFSDPYIVIDEEQPSGFKMVRLFTSDMAKTIVDTSRWLLANGFTSEVIWSVSRPELVPWVKGGIIHSLFNTVGRLSELVTQEEFKKRLLRRFRLEPSLDRVKTHGSRRAREFLSHVDFVVVRRAMEMPYRFSDLLEGTKKRFRKSRDFNAIVNMGIRHYNEDKEPEYQLPELLDGSSREIQEYNLSIFETYLFHSFDRLGNQVGRLHKLGVAHGYLHTGNITIDGNFCDIDSLSGKPLGDEEIKPEDMGRDFSWVLSSMWTLFKGIDKKHKWNSAIIYRFIAQYIASRWGEISETTLELAKNELNISISEKTNLIDLNKATVPLLQHVIQM